jgi:hypothetical protein
VRLGKDDEHPPASIMEASAPKAAERPLWVLNRDEQRVLIITFVGGLASIVVGACVIGGAIALARSLKGSQFELHELILGTVLYITVTATLVKMRTLSSTLATFGIWFGLLIIAPAAVVLLWALT